MILDLEENGEQDGHFDVCVVGAGAAGLVLAIELVRQGQRVLVLESGGTKRWERRTQALNKSAIAGLPFAGAHSGRFRTLGGSTTAWAGQIMELDEHDFAPRPWIEGSGWPITKAELAPYYARAVMLEGLDTAISDRDVWAALHREPPDFGEAIDFAFSRYCPEKKFAVLFGDKVRSSSDIVVYLHANACELVMDGDAVASVRCRTFNGRSAWFKADRYVLCMGGIESSRFLLQPQAVAPWQASDVLGRHFQDHIQCFAADIVDAKIDSPDWIYGPRRVNLRGFEYLPKLKLSAEMQRRHGLLNVSGMAEYEDGIYPALRTAILFLAGPLSAVRFRDLRHMVPMAPAVIWDHFKRKRDPNYVLPSAKLKLSIYCEQSPLSSSRITLTDKVDALGLRQASVDWRVSERELLTIRRYVQVMQQVLADRGLGRVVPDPLLMDDQLAMKCTDTFHHMGGTRMATTASQGVVDPNLRLFGTKNAYVCSTSVFPTSGFSNPTHTLLALAARLADHLSAQR